MHVDVIHTIADIDRLKDNWEKVYDSDGEAHFYLSWTWLSTWFKRFKNDWFVLAAKPAPDAANYVAFFPLKLGTKARKDGTFHNEIDMGGFPRADYTGVLCDPKFEDEAIPAFADFIRTQRWAKLNLEMFRSSEDRIRSFVRSFSKGKFNVEEPPRVTKDNIDNALYPYASLPSDWDVYVETKMSSNTRQKARRFLKKVDAGEFRITYADKTTFARDLDTLLRFWENKWGDRKGDRVAGILAANRKMMTGLFDAGAVVLPVFWKDETPLCANALLADQKRKALYFVMGGRDESFNSPPPGFILHAHTIRWAIQNGFTTYDFLMGNEPYKYMFGAEDRRVRYIQITTKDEQNLGGKLDPKSLAWAFDQAKEMHEKGKLAEAERGYRQILDTDPAFSRALYPLAQLVWAKNKHAEAASLLKSFVAIQPGQRDAWLLLGKAQHAQADTEGATRSFRKVLELDPGNKEVSALLAELSPLKDRLKSIVGAGPSWAKTDDGPTDFLRKLKNK